ncbi:MAG: DUF1295 domain-containing protein [Anaerolineales bacterium]|nr:DUF1295 domain-containing protein [Anaerolineales bacterium]
MKKTDLVSLIVFPFLIFVGALFAYSGSRGGSSVYGLPLFAWLVGLTFLIQWLVFIPAFLLQTEKFFDLTGSLTYISVTIIAVFFSAGINGRSILLAFLVVVWAIRLGTFLFTRIRKAGKDDRFDEIKPSFIRFLNVWTIQGLWVALTMGAALAAITAAYRKDLDWFAVIGFVVWIFGFAIEVAADSQKSRFNANPENKGKFIRTGLWSRSRHPNYFGEIVLWVGIAVIAFPVLQGWQWVTLISPVFVALLITRVSGVPQLETKADKKWGGQEDYEAYKKRTPVLIPRL